MLASFPKVPKPSSSTVTLVLPSYRATFHCWFSSEKSDPTPIIPYNT